MNEIFKFFRESFLARMLIPVGIVLIILSVVMFVITDNTKNYVKTDATVSKVELYEKAYDDSDGTHHEATYTVFVKYSIDNTEYEAELGVLSGYKVDDKVKIYYNPQNPTSITQMNSLLLPIILLVTGITSLIGGIVSIVVTVKKYKKLKAQEKEWKTDGK